MNRMLSFGVALIIGTAAFTGSTAAEANKTEAPPTKALEMAKTVTKITGVAISPLLGVSAIGAYDYFTAPKAKHEQLPWYAHLTFWLPALLLVCAVAAKDAFGTVLPPGVKKPLDVAEVIENKVAGLVAAAAFVPLVAAIFHGAGGGAQASFAASGFAVIDFAPLLNVLTVPLAMAAFVFVWLMGHVINVLILISPFGAVDAALKSLRTSLLGLLVIVHHINPWFGALLSLIIIVIAYFVAGWSFRLMVFGSVFTWDFVMRRRKGFRPSANANWMFTARKIEKTPIRTYGMLTRTDDGRLTFEYRPWLVLQKRIQTLPQGTYAVGRGLFYPDLLMVECEKAKSLLTMPPRYKGHEEEIAQSYGITDIRDTGLLKGIKAIWRWFTRNLFGRDSKESVAATTTT